jgi:hypothetical protein
MHGAQVLNSESAVSWRSSSSSKYRNGDREKCQEVSANRSRASAGCRDTHLYGCALGGLAMLALLLLQPHALCPGEAYARRHGNRRGHRTRCIARRKMRYGRKQAKLSQNETRKTTKERWTLHRLGSTMSRHVLSRLENARCWRIVARWHCATASSRVKGGRRCIGGAGGLHHLFSWTGRNHGS